MDALTRHGCGTPGGCTPVPPGWSELRVVVNFPSAYGGYSGWVNSAELVPVGKAIGAFVGGGPQPKGTLVRPAWRAGASAIQTDLCAPAGRKYWLVVDSGEARVLIGELAVGAAPGPYQLVGEAPPLGVPAKRAQPVSNQPGPPPAKGRAQPIPARCNPDIPAYAQRGCVVGASPTPRDGSIPPPSRGHDCNPDIPRYSQPGCH